MTTNNPQCGRPTSKNKPCKNPTITWPEPIPTCLQHQTTQERETRPTPGPHGAEPPVRSHPMTNDKPTTLTYDQAVALLPDGDTVHTFLDGGITLIGADWTRDSVLKLLTDGRPELSGPDATAMQHGLVAWRPDGIHVFIATRS